MSYEKLNGQFVGDLTNLGNQFAGRIRSAVVAEYNPILEQHVADRAKAETRAAELERVLGDQRLRADAAEQALAAKAAQVDDLQQKLQDAGGKVRTLTANVKALTEQAAAATQALADIKAAAETEANGKKES